MIFRHDFISLTTSSMVLMWRSFSLRGGSDSMLTMSRHNVTSLTPSGILAVAPKTRERMRRGLTPRSICACTHDMGPGTHTQCWCHHQAQGRRNKGIQVTRLSWKIYFTMSKAIPISRHESLSLKATVAPLRSQSSWSQICLYAGRVFATTPAERGWRFAYMQSVTSSLNTVHLVFTSKLEERSQLKKKFCRLHALFLCCC